MSVHWNKVKNIYGLWNNKTVINRKLNMIIKRSAIKIIECEIKKKKRNIYIILRYSES